MNFHAVVDTRCHPVLLGVTPQLFVTSLRKAAAFWREDLSFRVELWGTPPCQGLVMRDGARLNITLVDRHPIDPVLRERDGLLAATIQVDDVRELYEIYEAREVPMAQPLRQRMWRRSDFVVRDPDDNLICFAGPTKR